jgi:hypothetical protein
MKRRLFSAPFVVVLVACNALLGNKLDGEPAPPSVDASPDARADAPLGEDGETPVDAAPGCARYVDATFCNDFEGNEPLGGAFWTRTVNADAGIITLLDASPVSPPHAISFEPRPRDGGSCVFLQKERVVPGQYKSARVHVAVRPNGVDTFFRLASEFSGRIFELLVRFDGPATTVYLIGQYTAPVQAFDNANAPLGPARADQWITATLEVRAEPPKRASITVEGVASAEIDLPSDFVLADPAFAIGPHCASTSSRFDMDDFAIYLR